MRITIFQYDTVWMCPEENLNQIEKICIQISGTSDMLVLPEMFNTGYTMQPSLIPDYFEHFTIDKLTTLAAKYHLCICGSIPTFHEDHYFNTFITVDENGLIHSYNKIHLFTLAGEKKVYQPGNATSSFIRNGWKIQPLICFDLRFPYVSYGTENADIIIYVANWPEARINHWNSLLRARAIENQSYVIGVNRTGTDKNGFIYSGASAVINFNGDTCAELGNSTEYCTIEIHKSALDDFRKKLPFLNDKKGNLIYPQ